MLPITEIAQKLKLSPSDITLYGGHKAKILPAVWEKIKGRPNGHLVLVTAMTPTPTGEGKTVTTIGLAQGLAKIGEKALVTLREPSLGPVFGMKGGATGGGLASVEPAEEINLHFTGDFHALTTAQNLVASLIDNHLYFGNELGLDPQKIAWHRALDINDRALRKVMVACGQKGEREESFLITAASELMAVLCLSEDSTDLKKRLARLIVGYGHNGRVVTAVDLKAVGSMMRLLKEALQPNLVQTTEGVPAIIHGGPFANIAHGCNSLLATRYGLKLADYVVTEAGFGADLGAEKFFDIKCRLGELNPALTVVVATVRALKYHGGQANLDGLKKGLANLGRHVENVRKFGIPVVVAVNRFHNDTVEELSAIADACKSWGVPSAVSNGYEQGGEGDRALAETVREVVKEQSSDAFHPIYSLDIPIKDKIKAVALEIYRAAGVIYSVEAEEDMKRIGDIGLSNLPICIAKTQYSFSDDPKKLNAPDGFKITVRRVYPSAGAGFNVVLTGEIMTMPGLPRHPLAEAMEG